MAEALATQMEGSLRPESAPPGLLVGPPVAALGPVLGPEATSSVASLPSAAAIPIPVPPAAAAASVTSAFASLPQFAGGAGTLSSRNTAERREWTLDEDLAIREGVKRHGFRWRKIAAMLPGRSDDAVRNRWARLKSSYPQDAIMAE